MKITSGALKKRNIVFSTSLSIRPTKTRVRQAIFNILKHRFFQDFGELYVLDCFAGTGALGFEALSLGTKHVTFIEENYSVASTIKKSASDLNVLDRVDIHSKNVLNFVYDSKHLFDVVFLDPPYFENLVCPAIAHLKQIKIIHDKSIFCVECSKKEVDMINQSLLCMNLNLLLQRQYGDVVVCFYGSSLELLMHSKVGDI
jgi:16S rRNA (guanine(966)-N(2))-methyltransferase RsmD